MANSQQATGRPWMLEFVPFMIVILISVHLLALVYWIYRLATEKQPQRTKRH